VADPISQRIAEGNQLLSRGDAPGALAIARAVLEHAPESADAYNLLGTVYANLGDVDRAEAAYQRSMECDPSSYRPHANLATLRLKRGGDREQALTSLVRATELAPDLPRLFARRGQLERDLGRVDSALVSFARAHELDPSVTHRDLHGRALFEAGSIQAAVVLLEAAAEPSKDALTVLAHAYDALDRISDVARVLDTLVRMSPSFEVAEELCALARRRGLVDPAFALARRMADAVDAADPRAERAMLATAACEAATGDQLAYLKVLEARARRFPSEDAYADWIE
jgi:tetratricopeptide (TPR) repeat protein